MIFCPWLYRKNIKIFAHSTSGLGLLLFQTKVQILLITKYFFLSYRYYSGEKQAPVLTIFIGGNHEASNYLQELPYGGWVAPNIYYMGRAGVVKVGNLRIGGKY